MLPELNENGDLPPGIHAAGWIEIEQRFGTQTEVRARGMATLRLLYRLEELRKTERPENWPALSSGYLAEIERMQREVLDYLARPISGSRRTTAA